MDKQLQKKKRRRSRRRRMKVKREEKNRKTEKEKKKKISSFRQTYATYKSIHDGKKVGQVRRACKTGRSFPSFFFHLLTT